MPLRKPAPARLCQGAVDLVIQIEAPPSVASGIQRIGRGGHHVGAVSRGVIFPRFRGDLLACAAVTEHVIEGRPPRWTPPGRDAQDYRVRPRSMDTKTHSTLDSDNAPRWLTRSEAAEVARVSVRTIRRWTSFGYLRA